MALPDILFYVFAALTLLISIPIWTHPLPPLSDDKTKETPSPNKK